MIKASHRNWLWLVLAAAAALRLAGIKWGLPHTYNADEPHLVNLAVSFGGGSLKPYAFKYPTLWPYLLFAVYGIYFAVWSVFGLRHGVSDFIGLYGWHPTGFYLLGRFLAAASSVGGLWLLGRADSRMDKRWPWAAATLAVSPALVESAHALKPDSFMFLWACAAYYFALEIARGKGRRSYWACGACLGLALSSQFTALPSCVILPAAWILFGKRGSAKYFFEAIAASVACFLAGSPYVLLDPHRFWFWISMRDPAELAALGSFSPAAVLTTVGANAWSFAGMGSLAGPAAAFGVVRLCRRDWRLAVLLVLPVAAYLAVLANNPDGGWPRYLFGAFPALALLASEGLSFGKKGRALLTALLAATVILPGFWQSAAMDGMMRRTDTRALAQDWVEAHIPQGAVLLIDEPNAEPRLAMTREELEDLAKQSERAASPRYRLYRGMAKTHPGGGYRLFVLRRSAKDLGTYHPKQVDISQADWPILDVGAGLGAARAARVAYVITSSYGASPEHSPGLSLFFDELYREGKLVETFYPEPGRTAGPVLRVFRLGPRR